MIITGVGLTVLLVLAVGITQGPQPSSITNELKRSGNDAQSSEQISWPMLCPIKTQGRSSHPSSVLNLRSWTAQPAAEYRPPG